MALLEVQELGIGYHRDGRDLQVVDGLSFSLDSGQCLGLVGESGSGKSQTALAIMGLLPASARLSGRLRFENRELLTLPERERRRLRGARIGMIFQDPMSCLNPYLSIGVQLAEVLQTHAGASRAAALAAARRMLDAVQIADAGRRLAQYPHELSGGMRQRVMIAMMLLARPALLIADEPTTALDVTVQARILKLLAGLRRDLGLALLMISHDLGVIAEVADRLLVLYGGRAMEQGATGRVLGAPGHPYTRALIAARPALDSPLDTPLPAISGQPLKPQDLGGCPFAPRCPQVQAVCRDQLPAWCAGQHGDGVACHLAMPAAAP